MLQFQTPYVSEKTKGWISDVNSYFIPSLKLTLNGATPPTGSWQPWQRRWSRSWPQPPSVGAQSSSGILVAEFLTEFAPSFTRQIHARKRSGDCSSWARASSSRTPCRPTEKRTMRRTASQNRQNYRVTPLTTRRWLPKASLSLGHFISTSI